MFIKIIQIILGLFFIFSGFFKLIDLSSFQNSIILFNILPNNFINIATIIIPAVEIVCGFLLTSNLFLKGAVIILIHLLLIFSMVIGINLLKGNIFECGCFGTINLLGEISWTSVFFNLCLVVGLGLIFICSKKYYNIIEHLEVIFINILFVSFLINIPFGNIKLKNNLNSYNIQKISILRAIDMFNKNNAIIFDARTEIEYKKDHIPDALPFPVDKYNEYIIIYNNISKLIPIIIYCSNEICGTSEKLADKLVSDGFSKIFIIIGGFKSWQNWKYSY